jgi:hypothetical protein
VFSAQRRAFSADRRIASSRMRLISASGGKFKARGGGGSGGGGGGGGGGWFEWSGYVAGDVCGGTVLVMDVAEGESVAAADIVGVVVNVVIGVVCGHQSRRRRRRNAGLLGSKQGNNVGVGVSDNVLHNLGVILPACQAEGDGRRVGHEVGVCSIGVV